MNPTRQEAFDMAAKHLLTTRVPSGALAGPGNFNCKYSGTGCALRPFIPEDADLVEWDETGAVWDFPEGMLPEFIAKDVDFYDALQTAHDETARDTQDSDEWMELWKSEMEKCARLYNLDASILKEEKA